MELRDSRRLTGPNILTRRAGAVLDIHVPSEAEADVDAVVDHWGRHIRRMVQALGWDPPDVASRRFHGGLSLWLGAPVDVLYAATEINEWAWEAALASLESKPEPDFDDAVTRLRTELDSEQNPAVLELQDAAAQRGVAFLWDDDEVSVGMGRRSQCWASDSVPAPYDIPWDTVGDVPVALITGTNGKTTTVRLLKAMADAAGHTPGLSSTDGCFVEGEEIGSGDYSGPGGARKVLRDPRVDLGLLETARGGMLRRGLGVERADVALITNVAEDHLGEWGIHDLGELVDTKLIVAQAAEHLVLSADDPNLRQRAEGLSQPITWFSLMEDDAGRRHVQQAVAALGNIAWVLHDDQVTRLDAQGHHPLLAVADIPMTLDGAARHNVANALAAVAVAHRLGLADDAIVQGLRQFEANDTDNPGRLNRFLFGGADGGGADGGGADGGGAEGEEPVTAIVDFAHNPHGLDALLDMADALPARRRCVLVGQAGDRDDEAIRELPRLVWQRRPDLIILKALTHYLRGREEGDVVALMADELRQLGAPDDAVATAPSELDAVRHALAWARPGDLLLLLSHAQRAEVLELLRRLRETGWRPGMDLTD